MEAGDGLLHLGHAGAEVGAFKAAGDDNKPLQILLADFVLRRQLLDGSQRAERSGVARTAVEDCVLDGFERGAGFIAETHANGVRAAVGDDWICGCHTIENCGCILGDLSRSEAETGRDHGIDLEVGGRAADGILDAVLHIDHTGNLADGIAYPGTELCELCRVVRKYLELDGLGGIGEVADHVLQHLYELDVEFRLGGPDLLANICHYIVDGSAALGFQFHGKVAGVGFVNRVEPHFHAGTARGDFHLGRGMQDPLDVF